MPHVVKEQCGTRRKASWSGVCSIRQVTVVGCACTIGILTPCGRDDDDDADANADADADANNILEGNLARD